MPTLHFGLGNLLLNLLSVTEPRPGFVFKHVRVYTFGARRARACVSSSPSVETLARESEREYSVGR